MAVPLGCLYTPNKNINGLITLPYEPIYCKSCRAILNPFCRIDFVSKTWTCPFCFTRNHLPQQYAQAMSETSLPGELMPSYTTIEYKMPQRGLSPPVFFLVVDTAMIEDELEALKQALIVSLDMIPEAAYVGLITFGTVVQLYDLAYTNCVKSYVFKGDKEINAGKVQQLLAAFRGRNQSGGHADISEPIRRFLMPRSECEFQLSAILEDLQQDPWPVQTGYRPLRCTGAALSVATSLLELGFQGTGGHVMLFASGPCTVGDGMVVSTALEERLRSHHDIRKETAPWYAKADQFYKGIANRLVKNGHVCDLFACSLDQLGLMEMRHLVETTGGCLVNHEAFKGGVQGDVFVQSLMKMFEENDQGHLNMAFGARIEMFTSREIKVCGCIGPVASLNVAGTAVSDIQIGVGGTRAWAASGLSDHTTLAFFFEVVNQEPLADGRQFFAQIVTQYQHPNGEHRMRVSSVARNVGDTQRQIENLARGFDQEAAAVLTARYVAHRARSEETFDIMRWLDRMLIRLCSRFGQYTKDDASSFSLSNNFSIFPQFMFHLRRSQFLQVFNSSPDETTIFRHELSGQTVANCLVMIQPTLICYSLSGPPQPVLLDNTSIGADRILLLDAFFWITLWTGETIAAWRNQGYHEMAGYENVKQLLEDPKEDLKEMIRDRFPVPRVIETDQHKSQARFLLAKLNPSVTQATCKDGSYTQAASELIFTDDVSLQVFLEHLAKLAVNGDQ